MKPVISRPLVLMYHGLGTLRSAEDPDNLFVPVETFELQLRRLRRRGLTPIDEKQYLSSLEGGSLPPRSVLITFDDGYLSVLEDAVPVLRRHGAPAMCFVSAGLLGGRGDAGGDRLGRLVDGPQVQELAAAGVDIGCHGWEHVPLPGRDAHSLRENTERARQVLGELLGHPPRTFAYARGEHDEPARRAVRSAGFELAFSTHDGRGRLAVPRVDVNALDTARSFDLKITRGYAAARRLASTAPQVRRAIHLLVGQAERG